MSTESTELSLDQQIAFLEMLRHICQGPQIEMMDTVLASLHRLRALPREGAAGVQLESLLKGLRYIVEAPKGAAVTHADRDVARLAIAALSQSSEQAVGDTAAVLAGLEMLRDKPMAVSSFTISAIAERAIAALSPQAYTPAALSTTSADTSRERGEVIPCSRGDLTADDLEELVDKLCKPHGYEPSSDDLYRTQVALLYLSIRMRSAPAAAPVEMERDAWVPWKPGDALPKLGKYWCGFGTDDRLRGPWWPNQFDELRIHAYWSAPIPDPYRAIAAAGEGA